ncbi:helicase associated domain-containing protein [Streptomyces sp. NPDC056437]|uniref:helicase associated domain-containing protein n=1 Tax=Streptomyces sp. NPDC056437 TaxID=3345816 RepID=UPI0036A7A7D6
MLLRFGTHRDPSLIAALVKYQLIEPEHANWKAGHRAAVAYHRREGHLAVPYNHVEGAVDVEAAAWRGGGFPLGRWLSDQRRAMRAGTMPSKRAEDLEALGIAWEPADEAWEENLGAARAWFDMYGTLAAPVTAAILDRPVGQWLANARKTNGLGKDPVRAARRAMLLAAIDPDWRPAWSVDWQRHDARPSWRRLSSRMSSPGRRSTAWTSTDGWTRSASAGTAWARGSRSGSPPSVSSP